MNDIQNQVQQAIDRLVESGAERGLQVAVYRHGKPVVDAVAGVADPATGRPVTSDTLFFSYSIGKGVAATVVHVLAERGVLDYDTRIGYHAITWGYIVGEIIRRATGKPISEALRTEVAVPLGVADELFFAVPASEQGRMAQLEDAEGNEEMFGELPEDSPIFKLGPDLTAEHTNRADVRSANIPAGGTVTARSVARMYAALLGEVDGVRLISAERLRQVAAVAMSGTDQIFGFPTSWGLGYVIGQFMSNAHETQHV